MDILSSVIHACILNSGLAENGGGNCCVLGANRAGLVFSADCSLFYVVMSIHWTVERQWRAIIVASAVRLNHVATGTRTKLLSTVFKALEPES